jgi:DNA processing protein
MHLHIDQKHKGINMNKLSLIMALLSLKNIGNKKAYNYIRKNNFNIEKVIYNITNLFNIDVDSFKKIINEKEIFINRCCNNEINYFTLFEEDYPQKLLEISDPVLYLFYKGNRSLLNEKSIAIIGTRKPSKEAQDNSKNIAKIFGKLDITIVSGLAVGCDMYAHIGGLETTHKNIAVLPCSLVQIYPKNNEKIAYEIIKKNGCIISEYLSETNINKYNFIKRDRIVSALADAIIVVEATKKSGTTNTVKKAISQGKEIYSINYDNDEILTTQFNYKKESDIKKIISSINNNFEKSKFKITAQMNIFDHEDA